MSGPCMALSTLRTQGSFLSTAPMDIIQLVQTRIDVPGVGIFCRRPDCSEVIIHHSMDNQVPQSVHEISGPRHCLYGSAVPHAYRVPTVTIARQMLAPSASPLDTVTSFDVSRGTESRPEWLSDAVAGELVPALAGVTVALDADRLLVPRHDMSFVCVNTASATVRTTSLTFGRRNLSLGRAFLGAHPHRAPGAAVLSCSDGGMCYYDSYNDAQTFIGRPEAYGATGHITCMQTLPNTDALFVGYGKRSMVFDFRTGFTPVVCTDAPLPMWTSAAFFSEHAIASWNSLVFDHAGFRANQHCQFVDMRAPTQWSQLPHWNLPADVAAQWAVSVSSIKVH